MSSAIPILRDTLPESTVWRPRESAVMAGVAEVDVTPPVGIRAHNWGAARIGYSTGTHHPLFVSAVALATVGGRVSYIVTADLCTWGSTESFHAIADPVIKAVGATPDEVLLHAMHTHSGPSIGETDLSLTGVDMVPAYREKLIGGIVAAMRTAKASMVESRITWTYGRCQLAANRDLPCGSRDVIGFNSAIEADDTLAVGRITGPLGATQAVLVNYACHPTSLAFHNSLISPDFAGAAREVVEGAVGAPMVFLQGASGDLAPRDQYVAGTEMTDRNGTSLGYSVLAALSSMTTSGHELVFEGTVESGAPLGLWQERPVKLQQSLVTRRLNVPLEARRPLSSEELEKKWSHIDQTAAEERAKRALQQADGYLVDDKAMHPVWIWSLGDAVIVAHSGEAFSYLQTELRSRHPDRIIIVMNLTNSPGGVYLPTLEAYDHDRYQVWQTLLEPGSLESLVETINHVIDELSPPRGVVA